MGSRFGAITHSSSMNGAPGTRRPHHIEIIEGNSMNAEVPYLMSVTNLHKILDAIQKAVHPRLLG